MLLSVIIFTFIALFTAQNVLLGNFQGINDLISFHYMAVIFPERKTLHRAVLFSKSEKKFCGLSNNNGLPTFKILSVFLLRYNAITLGIFHKRV